MIPVRVDPSVKAHVVSRGKQVNGPLADDLCPVCDVPLGEYPVSLVYVGRSDPTSYTAAAVAVHDACTD